MRDKATRPTTIILSKEQADVLEKVKKKDNVFFTGPAGLYSHKYHTIDFRYILFT